MANGEWMNQLIAGLGGAFTGAGQARSRMAEEAEAQRKKMETENERARLKRIQELRGSPLTEASRSELFRLGDTPSNIAALQELSTPEKPKSPSYTQRMVGPGRRVVMTDPMTGKSIYAMTPEGQPLIEPREAPQEQRLTPSQLGAGLTFYSRYLEGVSPVEQARRKKLISDLETQFPAYRGNRGAIGYMLMGGMRGMPEDNPDDRLAALRRLGMMNLNQ
jgi:hypothetical protein